MPRMTRAQREADYERTAREYQATLTLENYAQSVPQANQHGSFQLSFACIRSRRPDIHAFNELLVQYEYGRPSRRRQVVPDNMVVLHDGDLDVNTNYAVSLQPARPFLVLDYPAEGMPRKDYAGHFRMYERELKVPYYLLYDTDEGNSTLFGLDNGRYSPIVPNEAVRCAIPEIEVEVGVVDGRVRYWFRGELVRQAGEIQQALDAGRQQRQQLERELANLQKQLADAIRSRAGQP